MEHDCLNREQQFATEGSTDISSLHCCIFWPVIGCCALQTLVEMTIFSVFAAKNLKNTKNLQQILAKNRFFWVWTRKLVDGHVSEIVMLCCHCRNIFLQFDNRLEDKPRVRTPICQSLLGTKGTWHPLPRAHPSK